MTLTETPRQATTQQADGSAVPTPPSNTDPSRQVPVRLSIDDTDDPFDMVDGLALSAFVDGSQPWSATKNLDRIARDATLLPADAEVVRSAEGNGNTVTLAKGHGFTVHTARWARGNGRVTVTAESHQLAQEKLAAATDGAKAPKRTDDSTVDMGFWYHASARGPARVSRPITTPEWSGIRSNYSEPSQTAFERLMHLDAANVSGRIILLHGPPGTGKTTALRCLARQWRTWAQVDCVLDPEAFFTQPSYLMEVVIGHDNAYVDDEEDEDNHIADDEAEQRRRKWRMLIVEDCDELIRGEAKESAGQALSRLLNLSDGLLGQGQQVLIAITTNERLDRLHPAVVRPGRCLAQIEVGPLSVEESQHWLDDDEPVTAPMTLAQLYARKTGTGPTVTEDLAPSIGQYL